jgi:microsomal epoxide hydrolase
MRESFVTTSDGVKLRVIESGAGPALVLVPGWGMTADIWKRQFESFSKGHRVVSFDPRGQGASEKPETGYSTRRRAQDISELMEQLKIHDAVVVGWSLGALEVADMARHDTDRLRALALIDNSVDRKYSGGLAPGGRLLKSVENLPYPQAIHDFVHSMFQKPLATPELERLVESTLRMPRSAALELLRLASSGEGLSTALRRRPLPVYFAITSRFKEEALRLKKDFPSVQVEVYEGAGHALFIDDANRFNQSLQSFMQSLP